MDAEFRIDEGIGVEQEESTGFVFHEVGGIVSLCSPGNTLYQIDHLRRHDPNIRKWELEEFINHFHPQHEGEREGLRISREFVTQLVIALREAYPERNFVVTCHTWGEVVSFYEKTEGAPTESEPSTEPLPENIWCGICLKKISYRLRPDKNEEFPEATWAHCVECDSEILVGFGVTRTLTLP